MATIMRKFIFKTTTFSIPFFILYSIVIFGYKIDEGDLLRLGYIFDISNYRKIFKKEITDDNIYYSRISEINLNKKQTYKYVVFGDSFSEKIPSNGYSYTNYLAKDNNVLLCDRFLSRNPIQSLVSFINGNIFDELNIEYLILESVERSFVARGKINFQKTTNIETLTELIKKQKNKSIDKPSSKIFFLPSTVESFISLNIQYLFYDNPNSSPVYKVNTTKELFSDKNNTLLFYKDDINAIELNNKYSKVLELDITLNKISELLRKKGIKLIVIPCADKYDTYWEYINNKTIYKEPLFFNIMDTLPKTYIYLNSKRVLKKIITKEKDLYFYDDTHWSPKGMKIIANKIINMTKSQ